MLLRFSDSSKLLPSCYHFCLHLCYTKRIYRLPFSAIMSHASTLRSQHFAILSSVYQDVKTLSDVVSKERKRREKPLESVIAFQGIKKVFHSLSNLVRFSYSEDALRTTIASVIARLHRIAFEIEQNHLTRFVDRLRSYADALLELVPDCPVQLTLFDIDVYHVPCCTKRPWFRCFHEWFASKPYEEPFVFPRIPSFQFSLPLSASLQ